MNSWNVTAHERKIRSRRLLLVAAISCLIGQTSSGQDESIRNLSLEELGDVPAVVSAKFPDELFDAPTGSYVFGESDLNELPVDSIAEMLRYAPGVHIVRPSNGIWGVGMRGINSRFFNRVQFTVDEQNVYSSIFAGLFGNQHDLLMDDVASVEVAYGPQGGTWDNNAVNGMVNVLMKTAFETEGTLFKTQLGTESSSIAARIGWAIDDKTSARAYVKGGVRDSSFTRFDYSNRWDTARAGFRIDKRTSNRDLLSVSTEAFYSYLGYAYDLADFETGALDFTVDAEMLRGVNSQAKWTRNDADGSSYSVRSWVSYSELDAAYAAFDMVTTGFEARGGFKLSDTHMVNLNLGGAYDKENTRSTLTSDFTMDVLTNFAVYGGFQDQWSIYDDRLKLSWGVDARVEDKSDIATYSPNTRIIYQVSEADRIWASYSQAERTTPVALSVIGSLRSGKRIDPINLSIPGVGDFLLDKQLANAISDQELDPESLDAFEIGYRRQFSENQGSFGINTFLYKYDGLFARTSSGATPILNVEDPYLYANITYDNLLKGEAYGFEATFNWFLTPDIEVKATYSRLKDSFESLVTPTDPFEQALINFSISEFDNSTPGNMATLNVSADFADNWNLNTGIRYASSYDFAKGYQPDTFQADARLTWQKDEVFKISLVGRNLLDGNTQEARLKDFFGHWTEIQREIYLEIGASF